VKYSLHPLIILGSSGFVGRYLCSRLSEDYPGREVHCFSRQEADLTDLHSTQKLDSAMSPMSTVIITAGIKRQVSDSPESFNTNLLMIYNLCTILRLRRVHKVIFFSSASVYGENRHDLNIGNSTPVSPSSYYGISKYASERLLSRAAEESGVDTFTVVRPPLIYGCGDTSDAYGPSGFLSSAIKGDPIVLWGDGSELREFVYVTDVARVISLFVRNDVPGVFNLVSGVSRSYIDIVDYLRSHFPSISVASRERTKAKVDNCFNKVDMLKLFGTSFEFTPLEDGLRKMIRQARGTA